MKKHFLSIIFVLLWMAFIATIFLLTGCRSTKTIHQNQTDSSTIVYREIIKERLRVDTVTVVLPASELQVIVKDSSLLENSYAKSLAYIKPDGFLYHDLRIKPMQIKQQVFLRDSIILRDSIVYTNKSMYKEVPVKLPIKRWQRILIIMGLFFIVLAIYKLYIFVVGIIK